MNLGLLSRCFPLTSHLWNVRKSLLTSTDIPAVKVSYTAKRTIKQNGSIFIPKFGNQEMETISAWNPRSKAEVGLSKGLRSGVGPCGV